MELKEDIREILMSNFEFVYCDTCAFFDTEECECCSRKSMSWSLSEQAADNIADSIMDAIEERGDNMDGECNNCGECKLTIEEAMKFMKFKDYEMTLKTNDDMSYAEYDIKMDDTPGIIVHIDPDDENPWGPAPHRYEKMAVPFECRSIEVLWALGYKIVANPVEAWRI